jgi:hypothetical protein
MNSDRSADKPTPSIPLFEGSKKTSLKWVKVGAVASSLVVASALISGYSFLRTRQLEQVRAVQKTEPLAKIVSPPEAHIYEDEARLRGSEAVITGTIRNISMNRLEELTLEMELKRRASQVTERRKINVEPGILAPGEEGHYTLRLPSSEWSGARVLTLNSAQRNESIAFKSEVGELRRPERLPDGPQKVVIVPRPRQKGEEFINTPDNPTIIR